MARDTSAEAARLQAAIHRRLTPAERFRMAIEMSEFTRRLSKAGLRMRHPEYDDAEIEREMLKQLYARR